MYNDFFKERNMILDLKENLDLNLIVNMYNDKLQNYTDNDDTKQLLIWDYELMCCANNPRYMIDKNEKKLCPQIGWSNGEQWPNLKKFEAERNQFYEECINNTENRNMRIRYLNYLIDNDGIKDKYKLVNKLCSEILFDYTVKNSDYYNFFDKVSRLTDIVVRFSKNGELTRVEDILINESRNLIENKNYIWLLKAAELLRYLGYNKKEKRIKQDTANQIIKYIEIARDYLIDIKDIVPYQRFSRELLAWYKEEKYDEKDKQDVLIEIGKAYEIEAEHQGGRDTKSNSVRASFLENAIQHYIAIGENQRIDALKIKVKKAYNDMGKNNEFTEFSTTVNIPRQNIEEQINFCILENVEQSFQLVSQDSRFIIPVDIVKESAERVYSETNAINKLFSLATIYEGRKIFQSETEEDVYRHNLYQHYNIMLNFSFTIIYSELWNRLLKQGLTCEMVIDRINKWPYMSEQDKIIIEQGIRNFFNEDYISSLHILVPRFENCFRKFFEEGGYATTSIKANATQNEQTFNDFLNNDIVKINIDKDFLFLIKFVMVEKDGYNLRNNIAHGLANLQTFTLINSHIVIYMYFNLTDYMWKEQ